MQRNDVQTARRRSRPRGVLCPIWILSARILPSRPRPRTPSIGACPGSASGTPVSVKPSTAPCVIRTAPNIEPHTTARIDSTGCANIVCAGLRCVTYGLAADRHRILIPPTTRSSLSLEGYPPNAIEGGLRRGWFRSRHQQTNAVNYDIRATHELAHLRLRGRGTCGVCRATAPVTHLGDPLGSPCTPRAIGARAFKESTSCLERACAPAHVGVGSCLETNLACNRFSSVEISPPNMAPNNTLSNKRRIFRI